MGKRGRRSTKGGGGGGGKGRSSPSPAAAVFDVEVSEELEFDVGARVQLLNLKTHPWPPPHTGTVVAHWRGKKEWPEHIKAPYLVLLDDGLAVYSMRTDSGAICATEVPPLELTFGIGGRVDCRFERDGNWFPGTITQRHDDWTSSPISTPPYFINFDYGRERPFWGPKDCIRPSETAKSSKKLDDKDLRFKLGDRVECFVEDEYTPGIVVKQWYYEADFANGHAVPYQVRLEESGDVIYAPTDADYCIRRASEPAKPLRFSVGDRVLCSREEGWVPGFVMKTNYTEEDLDMLVPYKVGLDNGDFVYAPVDQDDTIQKERPPLRFNVGDRVDCHLETGGWVPGRVSKTYVVDQDDEEMPYKVDLEGADLTILVPVDEDYCIRASIMPSLSEANGSSHAMVKLLIHKEEYDAASRILRDRIVWLRSSIKERSDCEDAACLKVDLSYVLLQLADVHEVDGSLDKMKEVLDEAVPLIDFSRDKFRSHRLLNVTMKLALHAALTSDKHSALKHSEKAVALMRKSAPHSAQLSSMLFRCGKLAVGCGYEERGTLQMAEGLDILTKLCGSNNPNVQAARRDMDSICQG